MWNWLSENSENIDSLTKIVGAAVQVAAAIVGGIWFLRSRKKGRKDIYNNVVTLAAEFFPYSVSHRLLVVHMRLKNVGEVAIFYRQPDDVLQINVKRIPGDLPAGMIELDKLPVALVDNGILVRNDNSYELDPGAELEETAAFIVEPGTYFVEGEAWKHDEVIGGEAIVKIT
jgi:hypothetical protein